LNEPQRTIPSLDRSSILGVVFVWGFAAFWNALLAAIFFSARNAGAPPMVLYAAASPFILVGIFLLGFAVSVTIRTIHFRSLVLHLETLPGVVGGRLAGMIQGAEGVLRADMALRLACWRRAVLSDSSNEVVWEDVVDIPAGTMMRSPSGASVPFRFDVPFECEPTGAQDDRIYWQLTVQTRRRAVVGVFEVPVHRTERSSPDINEKSLRPRAVSQPPYSKLQATRASDGAIEIRFPRPTWLWKWWLFTLVVAASSFVAVRERLAAEFGAAAYVVAAAAVLFLIAIIEMGVFFSPRRLRVGRDELRMRFLSSFRRTKVMPSAEIADFIAKYDNSTRKYDVDVQRADGQTYPWLMLKAVDKREAEWLAHELRAAVR
jgi:hypothetical protein